MGFTSIVKGQTTREKEPVQIDYIGMAAQNIPRGTLCVIIDGIVTISTVAGANGAGQRPCVSVEDVDNSAGSAGDLNIGVVFSKVLVAVQTDTILEPGDYVKAGTVVAGNVSEFDDGSDDLDIKVGAYRGIEGAVFARGAGTPFKETLSAGIVPEQSAAANDIVWVELLD